MLDSLISLIAPHSCTSCGYTGSVLCGSCIAELIDEREPLCMQCAKPCGERGMCDRCASTMPIEQAFLFGERSGVLESLINGFKFERKRSAYGPIATLLRSTMPHRLPAEAVFIPLPTIARHVRWRGYDHTLLIAKRLAQLTDSRMERALVRSSDNVQRGASKAKRFAQAATAFRAARPLNPETVYILVDDVITTGASVRYASQALHDAGAREIWVVVLARQPLDEQG